MAFIVADRVRETSASTGTGVFTLAGAVIGYQSFSAAIGNTNTTYYTISNPGVNEWEVGIGTVGAGTLTRTTILASSNGGSAVSFTSGSKDVFCTYPSEAAVFADNAVTLTNKTISGASNTVTNLPNSALTNDSVTIGSTSIDLGATATTLAGLTSVTSTDFVGDLTGTADTATTATNLAGGAASQIPYQSAAGTTTFIANGTAGQVLKSNGASAPSWGSNTITLGSTAAALGSTVTNITGLTSVSTTGVTVTGLTTGRVTYATTGGALTDSANLAFDGTTLAVTGALTTTQDSSFNSTGATKISSGTTAQRPAGTAGQLRFNITTTEFEGYNGTTWASVGGSAISNGFKNRIINGAMMIDQRNAGASVTPTNNAYLTDRWCFTSTQASKLTAQQNAGAVTTTAGFPNYLGFTSSSSYSVLSTDNFDIEQRIEGNNIADFSWGTANAATVTLSFWVRSSLTGTFGLALSNGTIWYAAPYTVNSANTWEYKTVLVPGATSGTWATDNSLGLLIRWSLGTGSTYLASSSSWGATSYYGWTGQQNVVGTNGATFYITGVQLEKGSTATSFDYRPYGTELALCQRYFCQQMTASGVVISGQTTICQLNGAFPATMRTSPTMGATAVLVITDSALNYTQSSISVGAYLGTAQGFFMTSVANFTGLTSLRPVFLNYGAGSGWLTASAEL